MSRKEAISILEQDIKRIELAQIEPQEDQQFIYDALQEAKNFLEQISKAGDNEAIQESSDPLDMRLRNVQHLGTWTF